MPRRVLLVLAASSLGGAVEMGPPPPPSPARVLTLVEALRLAHTQGREKRYQDEELRLLTLTLERTRRTYRPQPTGTLSARVNGQGERVASDSETGTLGLSQSLPTGGTATVSGSATVTHVPDGPTTKLAGVAASLRQPLLRGAGYLAWRETLTSAERGYVYAMRGYELFRQQLTLGTGSGFWDLQGQQYAVDQAEVAIRRAEFVYDQSRALMSIGRSNANDVFRAETALLQARQTLVDTRAGFAAALDGFKLSLALPVDEPIALASAAPEVPRLAIDAARAIASAMTNRLDLLSSEDRVRDSERALRLSRRDLLPQLDLDAGLSYGRAAERWESTLGGPPSWSAGLTLQLPLDRGAEELSYQRALLSRSRASRDHELARQGVIREVLQAVSRLRAAESSLLIQSRNRIQAGRRAEKARIDFEAGTISNRDLVEAEAEVSDAGNASFRARVGYRIAELELRKATGTLQVTEEGTWTEDVPPYAEALSGPAEEP